VSDLDFPFGGDAPSARGGRHCAEALIERAQDLLDMPRPWDGYPLTWHEEVRHVGDLTAIAIASLRASE